MPTEPIQFKPIADVSPALWHKPASLAFAQQISQIPISDSELLLTSSCLPIAIDCISDRPRVVAIIDQRFQRYPVIGPNGQWQKGYLPMALRCLPFRLSNGSPDAIEMAVNLPHTDEAGNALYTDQGQPTPEVAGIAALLRRLEEGKRLLQQAAAQLLIAGVLTPIRFGRTPTGETGRSFTVSRDQFHTLSGARAALLAKDSFLAIDLAVACIFSQRHLATLVSVTPADVTGSDASVPPSPAMEDLINPVRLTAYVDDQSLFSFEQYSNTGRAP